MNKIFDIENLDLEKIKNDLQCDFKKVQLSLLGGKENASLIFHISLDKKENWDFGIFQNSRYYILNLDLQGNLELYSKGSDTNKFRKKSVKSIQEAISYINFKIRS